MLIAWAVLIGRVPLSWFDYLWTNACSLPFSSLRINHHPRDLMYGRPQMTACSSSRCELHEKWVNGDARNDAIVNPHSFHRSFTSVNIDKFQRYTSRTQYQLSLHWLYILILIPIHFQYGTVHMGNLCNKTFWKLQMVIAWSFLNRTCSYTQFQLQYAIIFYILHL